MSLFLPTVALKRVTDISEDLLNSLGIRAVFLDVDNTLSVHGSQSPFEGSVVWAKNLVDQGFQLFIISNNFKERVEPFAAQFQLPFVHFAVKPLPCGYLKAKKGLRKKVKSSQCLVVGDQIFTDIIGANLCGMKSVLLDPIQLEDTASFRLRRKWERYFREKAKTVEKKKVGR